MYDRKKPSGVIYYDKEKTHEGYTLFTPLRGDGTIYLIDMKGKLAHSWKLSQPGKLPRLLPDGNLLCDGRTEGSPIQGVDSMGFLVECSWDGEIIWKYQNKSMHHDYFRKSNGNTVILCWEKIPHKVASKVEGGIGSKNEDMWSDKIIEIDREGKVVWEWHAYEHLEPDKDTICPLCSRHEWTHGNTVFVTDKGDILTSFRRIDTVGIIDRKTGDWKWKWGRGIINHQHDPTQLENGNILIFDNGIHKPQLLIPPLNSKNPKNIPPLRSPASRVIEVNPKTNEILWEYYDREFLGFFSSSMSGAQRLPNGNTLICSGNQGRFFEVTKEKEIVWEYFNLYIGEVGEKDVFRAYRYGSDYPGLKF